MKAFTLALLLLFSGVQFGQSQDAAAIDHARKIRQSLIQGEFEDVTREFTSQMAAALTAERLGQVWAGLKQQAGEYQSEISAQTSRQQGFTAVTIGCQFGRVALDMIVAFDADNKIAGLRFVPRP
jgi:uncharacterized protein